MTNSQATVNKVKEKATGQTALVSVESKIHTQIQNSIGELKKALPAHLNAERLSRLAMTTLKRNPKLYECNPMTFLGALFQAAQIGLELDVDGQCHIVPFWDSKTSQNLAQFIIGYKGYTTLFYRHQSSVSLSLQTVYKNDAFTYDLAKGECSHVPPAFGQDRGEVIGYYAYATMLNGGHSIKVMSKNEAMEWGKKYSKCWDRTKQQFIYGTPWATSFDAMGMKTCMLQLSKVLPKSSELQRALSMDETVKTIPGAIKGTLDMAELPNEANYDEPKSLPVGEVSAESGVGPVASKDEKPSTTPSKKISAMDVKIHQAKKEIGSDIYYKILGEDFGVEHMNELSDPKKEMFLVTLEAKIKARRK